MKKLYYFIPIFLILLITLSCEGPQGIQGPPGEDGDYDKQITLIFPEVNSRGTSSVGGYIFTPASYILKFNKNNYANVDSIIFTACIESDDENNYGFAELYNVTDSEIIDSSTVMTSSTTPEWVETGNIIDYLPDYDIDLTVRIRTENGGTVILIRGARLYLFRD